MPVGRRSGDLWLAWAGGFFDGEGTVTITPPSDRTFGQLRVSVTNTDQPLIDAFQKRWPGYVQFAAARPEVNRSELWGWQRTARRAAAFLDDILPYLLSDRLVDKVLLGLEFQASKRGDGKGDGEYRTEQLEYHRKMLALGQRGYRREPLTVRDELERLGRRRAYNLEQRVELASLTRTLIAAARKEMSMSEIAALLDLDRSSLYRTYAA